MTERDPATATHDLTRGSLIDLAAARLGGEAILASDEFFAPKSNLLKPGRAVFIEDKYTDHGKWMDGWETRRHNAPNHDWCIVRLGLPGVIEGFEVDTHHFKGNHPEACWIEGARVEADEDPTEAKYIELAPRTELNPDSLHRIVVANAPTVTHVRLNIDPDGGVARFRCFGTVAPPPVVSGQEFDLVALEHGGRPVVASDQFFSEPLHLTLPGRGRDMGDGWETRRRRGPGHDWVVLELGHRGIIDRVVVDTAHFKGNFPPHCSVETTDGDPDKGAWSELLPERPLGPDAEHHFDVELRHHRPATHARLNIYPDGGVSRLRLFGRIAEEATP